MEAKTEKSPLGAYAGKSGEERRELRRARLLAAGLEIFGTDGYASSSVKSVCAHAELTERYFYESFVDREDLLFAVYEMVANEVASAAFAATERAAPSLEARARAGIETFFELLTSDIRKARVLSFEVVGVSARLERRRRETIHAFAGYMADTALTTLGGEGQARLDPGLTSLSMVGATNELLIDWVIGNVDADVSDLIDHCTRMYVALSEFAFGDEPR